MSSELKGKVAVVTGAGTGIGHAIAKRFGHEGASVCVNYFGGEEQAKELAAQISNACEHSIAVKADVSSSAAVNAMVEQVEKELGPIDILVNNAGVEKPADFLDITEQSWDWMLHVDLKGAFLCAQACARSMKQRGGAIVNISSIHEDKTFPGFTPYCAAKGGMRMMMRNAALELAHYRIRVNNIAPGAIATPINETTLHDPEKMAELRRIIPLGRMGTPDDVADVAVFLASDRSCYVTGSTYYVDGGMVRFAEAL
ncbi:MAG TPA: glucose 1-dehydrogenase [Candidatus Dormibacteraeota bacterium]|nr:glucose 1-dehydrogenase [Candidatus Dormibacteraeota bacterium]